jgi:endonuclease-8
MPEGHSIHRVVVDQAPHLVGLELRVSSPNRRFESGASELDGRRLEAMDAWGKNLFYFFAGRRVLHVHLGMDGRFRRQPGPVSLLRVTGGDFGFDLARPKVCRLIDEVHQRRIVSSLGPDPIRTEDATGRAEALRGRPGTVGEALLDQSLLAGIGNVYRAEILFACGIHPERAAASITDPEWEAVWSAAVRMLRAGVADRGRIVTVDRRDTRVRDGRSVYVYGQRACARCGSPVRSWDLGGRVAYACETCQPLKPRSPR